MFLFSAGSCRGRGLVEGWWEARSCKCSDLCVFIKTTRLFSCQNRADIPTELLQNENYDCSINMSWRDGWTVKSQPQKWWGLLHDSKWNVEISRGLSGDLLTKHILISFIWAQSVPPPSRTILTETCWGGVGVWLETDDIHWSVWDVNKETANVIWHQHTLSLILQKANVYFCLQ